MSDLLDALIRLESDVEYQNLAALGEQELAYVPGQIPILISAPHGAVHTRQGVPKQEDEYSAGLARLIAGMTDAHVMYARRKSLDDPNWHLEGSYKEHLQQVVIGKSIRFVMDIHGAAEHRKFGIALGTLKGLSCPEQLEVILHEFSKFGFHQGADKLLHRLDVDGAFTAAGLKGQETITRFVWQRLGVPAAQFEIHPSLRIVRRRADATEQHPFQGESAMIQRTVHALASIVKAIEASFLA
jgi:hypothetical protein